MGWTNPPIPWHELERQLSGRPAPLPAPRSIWPARRHRRATAATPRPGRASACPIEPATPIAAPATSMPYAELHAHSSFSFLDGASSPEELAEEAVRLGLQSLAITDHDGVYGVVRFAEAARALGLCDHVRRRARPRRRDPPHPDRAADQRPVGDPRSGRAASARPGPRPEPGTRPCAGASAPPSAAAAARAVRSMTSTSSPSWPTVTGWSSPAAARGPCAPRSRVAGSARSPSTRRGPPWPNWSSGSGATTSPSS